MKRILTFMITLVAVITATAQKITPEQALRKAQTFAEQRQAALSKGQSHGQLSMKQIQQHDVLKETSGTQLFMYNIGESNGFVIVSADERTPDILGYADSGSIDPENMPENMRSWLEMYAQEIASMNTSGDNILYAKSSHPAIYPLISANWNQNAPYNLQCPISGGKQCVTGCVATAMAQALSVVRPEGCDAIRSRNGASELPSTTFNWSIIHDTYASNDQSASAQEVAKLMRYCGQAAEMEYSPNESGATTTVAADGLKHYFNISNSCHVVERQFCMSTTWDETMYNELVNQRPIIIGGQNSGGGHEFVCDGYDGNGLYHINWGWGGISNGYFMLNALSPAAQGIGGSNSGYNNDVDAIIGLKLKDIAETQENISVLNISELVPNGNTATIDSEGLLVINMLQQVFNMNNDQINNFEFCWGIYDSNDNLIKTSYSITANDFGYCRGGTIDIIYIDANGLANGTYRLKFLSRQQGAETWCMGNNSEFFIITININGNNVTITSPAMKGNNDNYSISDISITGNGLVGAKHDIQMTVKNIGDKFCGTIYIVEGNTVIGTISTNIDPQDTEVLIGKVTFDTEGEHHLTFYVNNGGFQKLPTPECSYTVYNQSYTTLTLSGKPATSYTVENGVYIIDQSEFKMDCTINNNTETDYRSFITYWLNTSGNSLSFINEGYAYVEGNNTASVTHEVMELEENVLYNFYMTYYTAASEFSPAYVEDVIRVMYKNTATAINNVPTIDTTTPLYSIDGRRVGTSSPLRPGLYIKNGKKFVVK